MGAFGNFLGKNAGNIGGFIGKQFGKEDLGRQLGNAAAPLSSLIKFKKGGRVKRTGKALVHKGEFVLPRGVAPTKSQKSKVAKLHKKRKGKKRK